MADKTMKRLRLPAAQILPLAMSLALAMPAAAQQADPAVKPPEAKAPPVAPPPMQTAAPPLAPPMQVASPRVIPEPGAIPPMPANTVSCVFDNLSIEDREITLMLIGLDFLNRGSYSRVAPSNPIVDRIVQEAVPRCAQAYRWSAATSAAAVEYAHFMLVREVVRQALDFEDRKVDPVESYYAANRSALVGKQELDDYLEEGFATHLIKAGWSESDRESRRLARVYLETLIARDRLAGDFTKATSPRPVTRSRARPARTTSRGTP